MAKHKTKPTEYNFIYNKEDLKKVSEIIVDYYAQLILNDNELIKKILTPQ